MTIENTCLTCYKRFTPRSCGGKPQIRCSARCRQKYSNSEYIRRRAPNRPTACAECAGPIEQSELGRPRRFCSDECKARQTNRRARRTIGPVAKPAERECAHCGRTFQPKRSDSKYCYVAWCAQAAYRDRKAAGETGLMVEHAVECGECGKAFTGKHPRARWCSQICQIRHRARAATRRRVKVESEPYADREIFERDGWVCRLCGSAIDPDVDRRHAQGATVDHTVPLSRGGPDTRANVAAAHNVCNRRKSAQLAEAL